MTKRNLWRNDETMAFLNIIEEEKCIQLMEERKFKTQEIFEMLEREMFLKGFYDKTAKQMEIRWKNLKKQYHFDKKSIDNGSVDPRHVSKYFHEMHNLLNNRSIKDIKREEIMQELLEEPTIKGDPNISNESNDELDETDMPEFEECFPALPSPTPSAKRKCTSDSSTSNIELFHARIKKVTKELNEDLFQKQKELVNYEFRLFSNFAQARDEKFKRIMESNTNMFLNGIKDLLSSSGVDTQFETTENEMEEENTPSLHQTWDQKVSKE